MHSSWEIDQRNKRYDSGDGHDGFERSTSAPPPQTSLLFGSRSDGNNIVGVDVSLAFAIYPSLSFFCSCVSEKCSKHHHLIILLRTQHLSRYWARAFFQMRESYTVVALTHLIRSITVSQTSNRSQAFRVLIKHHLSIEKGK